MQDYTIGKVIGVSGDSIVINLYDYSDIEENIFGVPENMSISITTEKGPQPLLVGQPGSFVSIAIPTGKLLAMITDISMKESFYNQSEIKQISENEEIYLNLSKRIISVVPVGTINSSEEFEIGTDVLPTVNNEVYAVLPELIDKVYESFAEGNFSIGKLSLIPTKKLK